MSMEAEAVQSDTNPAEWKVETFDNDGTPYIAIFCGPWAEERARQYAGFIEAAASSLVWWEA